MSCVLSKATLFLLVAILVTTLLGCQQSVGPKVGIVRFQDGSCLTSGSIEFRNITDGTCFASRVDNRGVFHPASINGKIGLPVGTYEVVIVQIVLTEDLAKNDHSHGHTVPRHYADYHTSGLQLTVVDNQTKPIEIVIRAELNDK